MATSVELEKDDIHKCVDYATTFLKASDELISQTLFPNAPLTQTDMNLASYEDFRREKETLECLSEEVVEVLSDKQKEKFREANEAWESFVEASVEVEGLEYEGGTIRPTVENLAATRLVRERNRQLEELLTLLSDP